ncbi:MAG TPA: DNA polymerase III subunit epsilon [Gammaproteobacteria bacterium]|jgi:DNA polymerase-3 subunit epsilon|nr:DNA polymerase III subunit epsilon [Gammaproteobacteria bacterium]
MRQIVLDTETTGLEPREGHRIIEIGCIEILDRRITRNSFHTYINPEREVDPGALEVHGIDNRFLRDKRRFAEVVGEFLEFIHGAELVIHNAAFDVGFLNHELKKMQHAVQDIHGVCSVLDTLELARRQHPGQKNSLDALCKRYSVDNSGREYHGALLDAQLLAEVYLAMTGGQAALVLDAQAAGASGAGAIKVRKLDRTGLTLVVPAASEAERAAHAAKLQEIAKASGAPALWPQEEP